MEKMKTNNLPMKIICTALAIILWVYVSYEENPSMSKTVKNVPLAIAGEQALKENGFSVYSVSEKSVNVRVTAKRLSLGRITNKTLSASVNVSSIKQSGEYVIPAAINSSVSANASYYVKGHDVTVVIEPIETKKFEIRPDFADSGSSVLIVRSSELSSKTVTVSAPKSILGEISSVTTQTITPNDPTVSRQAGVELIVLGKDGKKLEGAVCSPSAVDVSYQFYDVKTVPVHLAASGLQLHAALSQNEVTIYGYGDSFNKITSISTAPVDLSQYTAAASLKVPLDVPDGVHVLDGVTELELKLTGYGE